MNTILDSDALVGMFYEQDPHYTNANFLIKQTVEQKANIYILPTTLNEFALVASSRIGMAKTHNAISVIRKTNYPTIEITDELTSQATHLYLQQTSKEESLFDCFVMAAAKKIHADCIFSFDKCYTKNGFVLLEDYLKKKKM